MSLQFNGTDEYLTIHDANQLVLGDAWSISMWCRPTDATFLTMRLWTWGDPMAALSVVSLRSTGGTHAGKLQVYMEGEYDSVSQLPASTTAFTGQTWYHVALVCGENELAVWVDGENQSGAGYWGGSISHPETPFVIGAYSNFGNLFKGRLAEYAKWDVALDETAIGKLAAGSPPNKIGTLPAWWLPMYEDADEKIEGLTVTDESGGINSDHPVIYARVATIHQQLAV